MATATVECIDMYSISQLAMTVTRGSEQTELYGVLGSPQVFQISSPTTSPSTKFAKYLLLLQQSLSAHILRQSHLQYYHNGYIIHLWSGLYPCP